MKRLLLVAALMLASAPARAQEALWFGLGADPCHRWITGQDINTDVGNWIFGFWTGLNASNDAAVGRTSHGMLLGQLKADCHLSPAVPIGYIVERLYARYQQAER